MWPVVHEVDTRLYRNCISSCGADGVDNLMLDPQSVPRLADVNKYLQPLTAFEAKAVAGYVPAYIFFDCLRQRQFPTTITILEGNKLD